MTLVATDGHFVVTAVMEILGGFPPCLWLSGKAGPWVLLPAASALKAFVWLWLVVGVPPTAHDLVGSSVALLGIGIIMSGAASPRH